MRQFPIIARRQVPPTERRFLEILSRALSKDLPFMAVIALSSDFLGQLQSAKALTARFEEFSLGPMPLARVPQIIEGPARVAGVTVQDAFVHQAARDAETEDALPLLAFALREVLDRSPNKFLGLEGYKALGDEKAGLTPLENAVRQAADRVLVEVKPADDELAAVREAFVAAMVRINDKGEYVRRPARWDALPAKSYRLLELLRKARLLIVRQDGDARVVEVAHEALLRKWPLLRSWLDAAREFLIGKQQLEQDLRDWEHAAESDKAAALLSGLKLNRARGWLVEQPMQLSAQESAFIEASIERAEAEERRREEARHGGLVNSASFSADGASVVTASDNGTARLWDAATGVPIGKPLQHERSVISASFSPDGAKVVTASEDSTARVWIAPPVAPGIVATACKMLRDHDTASLFTHYGIEVTDPICAQDPPAPDP
jgi:WD domain, G-beta repeat